VPGSGQALYGRIYRLTIATPVGDPKNFKDTTTEVIEIENLRLQFDIRKALKKEPNTGEIRVTNLSSTTRANLQKKGVRVRLEAGYKDTGLHLIFSGDVRTIDHVRQGADWETILQLGDGERAWQFARVNESFSSGTGRADVVRRVAEAMGIEAGNVSSASVPGTFDQGWCASGSASREFDRLMKACRLEWSIQDGALQVLEKYQALNQPIEEISPTSGLIGSPEMGSPQKKGKPALVRFKALMGPCKPGAKIRLKSERYDGEVRVVAVTFTGDTAGGPWYREISGEVLK
jgi:hypothetical protein